MGSLGSNGETKPVEARPVADGGYDETQPFDSPSLLPSWPGREYGSGENNEYHYLEDTVPFNDDNNNWQYLEDTQPFHDDNTIGDALDTQVMNFAGETQILNISGETQPLDDIGGAEEMDMQLLDDIDGAVAINSDDEGTGTTEVLENVDELPADNGQCGDSFQTVDSRNIQCEPLGEHGNRKLSEQTDAITDKQTNSGDSFINFSGPLAPRFTFLCAESLREAALAAHNIALKQTNGEASSIMSTSPHLEPLVSKNKDSLSGGSEEVKKVEQECDHGQCNGEVERSGNKTNCKVVGSAVRKLFDDDLPAEIEGSSLTSIDVNGEGFTNSSMHDNEVAGLSYVDSQEPGELSQANALEFVDRFLEENIKEFEEATHAKNVQEKSHSLHNSKGKQILAKRVIDRQEAGKTGMFDWDDSHEDESGGDIFVRRKKEFFEDASCRRKSLTQVQKIKASRLNGYRGGEGQSSIPNKQTGEVQSDSRVILCGQRLRDNTGEEIAVKPRVKPRNLINELNEQFKNDPSRGQLESNVTTADALEMLDVGLDTQMAAEAMEALCNGGEAVNHDAEGATHVTESSLTDQLNNSEHSVQHGRKRNIDVKLDLQTSILSKKRTKEPRQAGKKDNLLRRSKKIKLKAEVSAIPSEIIKQSAGSSKRSRGEKLNKCTGSEKGSDGRSVDKEHIQGEINVFTPIAHRTRRYSVDKQLMKSERPSRNFRREDRRFGSLEKRNSGTSIQALKALDPKSTVLGSDHIGVDETTKLDEVEKMPPNLCAIDNGNKMDKLDYPRRRRSLQKFSSCDKGSEDVGKSTARNRILRSGAKSIVELDVSCWTQSYISSSLLTSSAQKQGKISEPVLAEANPGASPVSHDTNMNSDGKSHADFLLSAKGFGVTRLSKSPSESKSCDLGTSTPASCKTPVNDASPICMSDDYYKQSCKLSRSCIVKSLHRELRSLSTTGSGFTPSKYSRRRKDMTDVRVLYSRHLDGDIIKHQKKILERLGASVAMSIADATHFISDQFVRTRNMLEAIASGKPVVTHLWLESCGQASCFIDEKNYILRDANKEKEFGFSMPVSLAHASRHPLLQGRKVLITPNTKPSKEIISSLVKAVQGQPVERIGRSALKDEKIPDGLLILSCEEDYATCVSFLEKGAEVYSSELLLNGIVTQKLEYERHRLFADQVKKTRSTVWLKRDGRTFHPVTKCK